MSAIENGKSAMPLYSSGMALDIAEIITSCPVIAGKVYC